LGIKSAVYNRERFQIKSNISGSPCLINWKRQLFGRFEYPLFRQDCHLKINVQRLRCCYRTIAKYAQQIIGKILPKGNFHVQLWRGIFPHDHHRPVKVARFVTIIHTRSFSLYISIFYINSSMTQLLTHSVAHTTRPSFRPKTNNQSIKKLLSLTVS
jgi:hypothetical protein